MNNARDARSRSGTLRSLTILLGAAVLVAMLTVTAPPAKAVELKNVQITSVLSGRPAQGGGIYNFRKQGLLIANQKGRTSKKGTRPLGIIAILIGLKAGDGYALAFSGNRCSKGGGGLVGQRIGFTANAAGLASVKRSYRLTSRVLNRSKSLVLLSRETGKRFQACGRVRVAAGDFNQDGIVDAGDF